MKPEAFNAFKKTMVACYTDSLDFEQRNEFLADKVSVLSENNGQLCADLLRETQMEMLPQCFRDEKAMMDCYEGIIYKYRNYKPPISYFPKVSCLKHIQQIRHSCGSSSIFIKNFSNITA